MQKKWTKFPHKCAAKNCRGIVGRDEHSPWCPRCRLKKWRAKHPVAYAWGHLKRRARAKGIRFTLTKEDYAKLSDGIDLTKMLHRTTLSLTVDRTDSSIGYHVWNVKMMSLRSNDRKSWIPFWNGGEMPQRSVAEQRSFDVIYRNDCENLADEVGELHTKGSIEFWVEFHRRKIALFEKVTA